MSKYFFRLCLLCLLLTAGQFVTAQERRPIDNRHPLWLVHVDVWNSADPQKIIDLIPYDIRPYVCMNLSLSCQYDTKTNMYRMPRNAVRTYKSWASVCQQNGLWFTCQPASGGHTHIQDNDLETFEYFFKTYPNFLGWNYAEQFWGFGDAGDKGSMTTASRWALFANLVKMSHKYGGFLTVSWCGGIYHFDTDPIAELKLNNDFLEACKNYPEAIVFLYKYTHASSFYNNETVCFGPFISGLTKNYGVRYDNCGWNDAMSKLVGENKCKYPGSAGIGTVMEQTCVNGGAIWDGPELIWTEDFQNLPDTQVDGYTRRNWGTFANFKGIWLDMWRRIVDGTMYIPSREEVVDKTKVVIVHDTNNDFRVWDNLYDGLYKQTDPANAGTGNWGDNLCYFKSTGRYGAIPMVTGLYDDAAKAIPVKVQKSQYTTRWGTSATATSKKVTEFNELYPEVSQGDLYVNRYRNQLVTYTPYTYLNQKKTATALIPLQYNTCDSMKLTYGKLSSGIIREYSDHIDFYLNNYRSDTTTQLNDLIVISGVTAEPTYKLTKPTTNATSHAASISMQAYDAEKQTFTISVLHMGPAILSIQCAGAATERLTDVLPTGTLEQPQQPDPFVGPIIIEAENMDRKSADCKLTHSGWWAPELNDFAGMGYIETQANTNCALRHDLKLTQAGEYNILVRYCNSSKAGNMRVTVNSKNQNIAFEKAALNDWREATVTATMKAGTNTIVFQNTGAIKMYIDQVTYEPVGTPKEKFAVSVRDADFGSVTADVDSAVAGQTVHLTITPEVGYGLKALNVVNSVYYTQGKTLSFEEGATKTEFVMPDDNVTIQPLFYDIAAVYELNFTDVASGALPVGWRTTDGSDVRNYPTQNGSGPRTFAGLTGYQGKALYWRNTSAEYGWLTDYPLTLEPGSYELVFAMAAWKESPVYQVNILTGKGNTVKSSGNFTAAPNVQGNSAGDISGAVRKTLNFDITAKGKYVIQFKDKTSSGGYHEFLLAECRLRFLSQASGITSVNATDRLPEGIYSITGIRRQQLQPGLNIVVDADGNSRKVFAK
ncbi:MAG: glycosyl hydrolase family 98 [Bacteroidales bacterium]|nr:glycosyl hydrolase family 98 [Bacteroidales bacterium]